jgi:hypothetical protein
LADVNANIGINFDTSQALAELRQLQAGLSRFNQTLTQGNVAAMNAQKGLNAQLMQAINSTGKFVATQKDVATSTSSFTSALEKNQLSMKQYFRYTAAAATMNTKVFKNMFAQERETLTRASKDRVKLLQSQYIQMQAANGNMIKVLQVIPKHLKMVNGQYADYATRMQMAAQRQQFLNQLLKQGSTQLLNFGKNTQWAGRQLMVGLTIPLSILGSTAAKTFMEMEQVVTKFLRVYGDLGTRSEAANKAIADIQRLGKEFTKYGIAVKDTVEMAGSAAAMGLTGTALNAQVVQATRLAVLGQVEQQQALETTISLTNAFGIATEDLAKKINFLNAVENQTVLSIEDLTIAIPKAGPVIKQLGGSVEDLAFFMTAMKEGGINASEGANALKSGLASMINPSKKASEFLGGLGINIKGLVEANKGDLKGTVVGFARALDTLDPLNRARAIEQLFGKFQFARLSTLFQNVTKDSSQAARALGLAGASVEELAILSERELGKVEDMTGNKFKKSMENLKLQLVPIGKAFLQAVTPIVSFVGRVLEKFNTLSDGTKKVITIIIGVIGGLAPVALMTFGVLMNAIANGIKLFARLRGGIAQLNGSNNVLGGGFEYLTNEQIENVAQANALHTSHSQLISTFNVEAASVQALAAAYGTAASQARALAQSSPGLFNTVPGPAGAVAGLPPKKFATGGVVPGTGNKDTVPALLTPGEVVITKDTAKANPELVAALQNDSVKRYGTGTGDFKFNQKKLTEIKQSLDFEDERTRVRVPLRLREKRYSAAGVMAPHAVNHNPNPQGETGMTKEWLDSPIGKDGIAANVQAGLEEVGTSSERVAEVLDLLKDKIEKAVDTYDGTTKSWREGTDELLKSIKETKELTDQEKKIIQQRIAPREEDDFIIPSDPVLDIKPPTADQKGKANTRDERSIARYYGPRQKEILKEKYPDRAEEIDKMEFSHLPGTAYTYGGMSEVEPPTANITDIGPDGKEVKTPVPINDDQLAVIEKLREEYEPSKLRSQELDDKAFVPIIEVTEEDKSKAAAEGAKVGQAAIDGASGPEGADNNSPSKKGRKIGKDIADGIVEGMQEGTPEVTAQSSRLGDAAVPTAAETRAKVDKMDLDNKSFYDDIDTPEFRDERQILKSQDRQRRKRAKEAGISGGPGTPPVPGPSSITVSSTARTEAAAEDLAVSTEQAATAQSQVVQQIHDESKSRVTIKGNTINIGKARQEADRLDKEASDAEAAAAKVRTEAAKWEEVAAREGGKNMHTSENAKALKKLADEAEIKAAEARIKAAEAEIVAAQLEADAEGSEQIIQDPVKTPAKVKKAEEIMSNGTVEAGDGMRRIVDGTDETADSTLLVAEQTDELASVTGEAVDAQTETAGNLLTGAQITDATTGNMNDVLQSTDITGVAQDDIAGSSQDIAETNELIAKEKKEQLAKLRKYNADEAARIAAQNGIIPEGSQTENVLGKDRMDVVEAYEEAMGRDPGKNGPDDPGKVGYTKDKKGHLLFDPETGQPTTLTEKQLKKKKVGMRVEKVSKVSGKISGGLGTAAMVAGMAGAPPAVTGALGGAATVAQFAPMITKLMSNPYTAAATALVAVAAGAYLLNKKLQATAEAIAKFTRATTVSADLLKKIGEQTGKVGASEIMNRRRGEGQLNTYVETNRRSTMASEQFLKGDAGKALQASFVENAKKNGTGVAAEQFALQLAAAVSDGTIAPDLAQDIATQMGINLKDSVSGLKINLELRKLIGPSGEDLAKDPLEVRARIARGSAGLSEDITTQLKNKKADNEGLTGWMGNPLITGLGLQLLAGSSSGSDKTAALAVASSSAIETAQAQADAMSLYYDNQLSVLRAQRETTSDKAKQLELDTKIKDLLVEQEAGMSRMNNLVAAQIQQQVRAASVLIEQNKSNPLLGYVGNNFINDAARREDAYFDAQKSDVKAKFKGTAQEASAQRVLDLGAKADEDKSFANKDEGRTFEARINLMMQSGQMQPEQIETMMKIFNGDLKQMDTILRVGMRLHGGPKVAELASMLQGVDKQTAKKIMVQMIRKSPEEFDRVSKAIAVLQRSDGMEIDMQATIKTIGMPGLIALSNKLDLLEKLPNPIEKETVVKFGKDNGVDVQGIIDNWSYYEKLKPEIRKEAIQTYTTLFTTATSFKTQEERLAWANLQAQMAADLKGDEGTKEYKTEYTTVLKLLTEDANGNPLPLNDYKAATSWAQKGTEAIHGTNPTIGSNPAGPLKTTDKGGKKDDPLLFLESLAMRIKMVRDQSFNAKKPVESMLAAFNSPAAKKNVAAMFKSFDGLQQKLIALKVPEEFRDYISSLDAQGLEDLMKADLDRKKAGQQGIFTYGEKKDKKGKTVKDAKGNIVYDKTKIVGISQAGKAVIAAYNEAPIDKFNEAQQKVIVDTDNQFKAFTKLKAAGVDTATALDMVADASLAGAIASKQYDPGELERFAKDVKNSADALAKAAVMSDLLKKNADFKFKAEAVPKLAAALKQTGMSVENIQTVLSDPALAKELIKDLEDGKIDSAAIAEYLNNIKDEKIVEIRGKFNAGDFAGAAAPGMELVNKMFSVQEGLIRTGASALSTKMVKSMKALKNINDDLQLEIQEINVNSIRPIEKIIETATRNLELNISRPIEAYQESINDLQRTIEIAFERPIAEINAENTIMSEDLEVMNHAAEEINKRYDEQAEALAKVSEIKGQLVEQEKEQLDLADALSKGDIGAAARAIQAIRAAQAARNAENASKALELSRKNKIDNLRGEFSGLTKEEIAQRQYDNSRTIYDLENTAQTEATKADGTKALMTRLEILKEIQDTSDKIYKLEEDREAAQIAIRKEEDKIYTFTQKIQAKQDTIDENNFLIAKDERAIEKLINGITVLGQTKDAWDAVTAKIDASALAGEDFDRLLGSMLASVDKIQAGFGKVEDIFAKYSDVTQTEGAGLGTALMQKERTDLIALLGDNEVAALKAIKIGEEAIKQAQKKYDIEKAAYDLKLKSIEALEKAGDYGIANSIRATLGPAPILKTGSDTADNPNENYNDPTKNAAKDLYNSAAYKGTTGSDWGGKSATGSSNVPSPGQNPPGGTTTKPPTGTTTKPPGGTTTKPPATTTAAPVVSGGVVQRFAPLRAQGTTAAQHQAYLALANSGTYEGLTAAKSAAKNAKDKAFDNLKNYKGKDASGNVLTDIASNTETDYQRLTLKSREGWDKLNVEYQKANNQYKDFERDSSGKSATLQGSKAAEAIQKKSFALLPQWVKDSIKIINDSQTLFDKGYSKFLQAEKAYNKVKKDKGFDKLTWAEISKDPEKLKIVKPSHDAYAIALKQMIEDNNYVDKARWTLRDDGYTNINLGWAIDGPSTGPNAGYPLNEYSASGDITPEYLRDKKMTYYATGGFVASKFGQKKFSMGTDTVPAMLTPGEFVMNKFAVQSHGIGKMQAMNSGQSAGDAVYNYSISVNVKSESNPDEIARTVIAQIKSVDAQKMRGVRK